MTIGTRWYVRRCAIGTAAALAVYLLLLALCSFATVRSMIGEGQMARCVWLCTLLAAFAGAVVGSGGTVRRGVMTLCCGAAFYLAVLLFGFLIGGTLLPGSTLRLPVPTALGALSAYLMLSGRGSGRKRGKKLRRGRR